ncbi:MAG TPA: L,D-transpeptidase family protein [Hyphomicrobiaceae bacterium]|nr:L,D-transpeptidase family protein [Hyphomicrobiaceae bacterium]
MKFRPFLAPVAALSLLGVGTPASAQPSPSAAQISAEVEAFHQYRFDQPFWTPAAVEALLRLLETSAVDGLAPQGYQVARLRDLAAKTMADPRRDRRAMDLALSAAFVRYAAALAQAGDTGVTYVDPAARPRPVRPTLLLLRARESGSVETFIEEMAWMNPIYAQTRRELLASGNDPRRSALLSLNLKRARALPRGPARYILVNIPSARLEVREGTRILESMKVVVGMKHTQTPEMAGMIRYAIQNPSWHIPTDITRDKVAPRVLKEGTAYLRSKEYEVLSDFGPAPKVLDPAKVDWKAVVEGRVEAFVRQKPGPTSGLGKIVFKFPNEMGIYLHDTPGKSLFKQDDRLASAGCVRLENPDGLSKLILGDVLDPTATETDKYVPLLRPVPVYLSYLTAYPVDGKLVDQRDIYNKDKLPSAMTEGKAS